jgi:hypothetical protein
VQCPTGTFASATGMSQCVACTASMTCAPGRYPISSCTSTSDTVCESCPKGSFCVGGSSNPVQCPTGTFASSTGMSACVACNMAISCPMGQYLGSYCTRQSDNLCLECPINFYCVGGSNMPQFCSQGTHAPVSGMSECASCTSSAQCDPGTYYASSCPTFSTQKICAKCKVGSYCQGGFNPPIMCSPGSYAPTSGLSKCTSCSTSTYSVIFGASACTQCALTTVIGTYRLGCGGDKVGVIVNCTNGS